MEVYKMRVVVNENDSCIKVGDVVHYGTKLCWVIYDTFNESWPIRLVDLTTGDVVDGFTSVSELEKDNQIQLYSEADRVAVSFDL